jgi:cobalt-zinc-cadmium efflux system outer membrane protein
VRQRDQVIRAEIQSALNQFQVSAERVEAARSRLLPRAEESRKIAEALYEEGATNLLQLLDAQRAFNEARLRAHQILFEYQVSRSLLERAVGIELTALGAHQ